MNIALKKKEYSGTISAGEMVDGDIGEIIKWGEGSSPYKGLIVQRFGDFLIQIGAPRGNHWELYRFKEDQDKRIRILEPGDSIEIVA